MALHPWVTRDAQYDVVSVLASPIGRVQLQIVADDRRSLAWFDSIYFATVETTIPASWSVHVGEGGVLEIGPAGWHSEGFWEAYYDGDRSAAAAVDRELRQLGPGPDESGTCA